MNIYLAGVFLAMGLFYTEEDDNTLKHALLYLIVIFLSWFAVGLWLSIIIKELKGEINVNKM